MNNSENNSENNVLTTANVLANQKLAEIADKIDLEFSSVQYSLANTACYLKEAKKWVKDSDFGNIGQFGERRFGIKKARVSQLVTVAERFLEFKEVDFNDEIITQAFCKLPHNSRQWTMDSLYYLSKLEDDVILKGIEENKLSSDMSNSQIEKIVKATLNSLKALEDNKVKAENKTENVEDSDNSVVEPLVSDNSTDNTKKSENTVEKPSVVSQIKSIAEFIQSILDNHANSQVTKAISAPLAEIIKLCMK